ncbi:MAG: peptidylprolyl isomerase [Deferribacteres bacterium]|nr:peptidylprolyl isomerase [candidate division KSB1 bacterium]MCB9502375.1 peptidylprolyl isomerase [Deferribacteres bacterium]
MKQIFYFILALSAFACSKQNPQVVMKTDLGDMTFEIYPEQAPITAANFLEYVDNDLFKGAHFYRVVTLENQPNDSIRIEVVQGGLGWNENEQRLPAIAHETTAKSGILHEDGVISMARGNPGTADSEFFICVGAQPELDFGGRRNPDGQGFATFGRVIEGMDVVRKIQQQPEEGQMLIEKIAITSIRRK